ncbi:Arylsulphatase [Punctularia strigosozonata HHB-11173 SS5]|uniref:Arylsulphatase n=1 Tax=Punctularia strigosozonata (strain HHB-11173) TaxID=741275 RepID=UPI000441705A|nr:Arylsulphatase [Punctularia strigosozonata HHB-11173 SS5]EIN14555.1 Arylsulphatase [Punctularia strigosozonata HHB-11173 SS5]
MQLSTWIPLGVLLRILLAPKAVPTTPKRPGSDESQANLALENFPTSGEPNILFILTDDQDLRLDSLEYMPFLQRHLIKQGTLFQRHFCTTAICCPSRVSLWTGKSAHNTNVTNVSPPYGGYPKFVSQGLNDDWLFPWLQEAGYNTYYTGKLFNAHTVENYNSPFPSGFTGSDFLLDPYTYQYYNSTFQRNKNPPILHDGVYQTDLIAEKAYGFLSDAVNAGKPFFLAVAPTAPHANVKDGVFTEPQPARRHEKLFQNARVPRTDSFNPEKSSGANWVLELPQQNKSNVDYNDHLYRQRLRALQSVDEMIDGLITRLEQRGLLDSTYIIYTADNGYHIGQHRLQPGKTCGYEEDINVPLIVRGPEVPQNKVTDIVTTHTDLAPTIFSLLGLKLHSSFDGAVIPLTQQGLADAALSRHEHANVEFWGIAIPEGIHAGERPTNNTYKALRLVGRSFNLYYSVWCNNKKELYDLSTDPYQMYNLIATGSPNGTYTGNAALHLPGRSVLLPRLDALLLVLKSCVGNACINPWKSLHPTGEVRSLEDALKPQYNAYYTQLPRVEFTSCEIGYIIEAEGPQWAKYERQ